RMNENPRGEPARSGLPHTEIEQSRADISTSTYFSRDLAPVPATERTWRACDLAVLWISMSACVPTYMLASSLIDTGMSWWQAVLTIFLGNCIVLVPMALNAHAGTRYGIPFPVYCRAAFGLGWAYVQADGFWRMLSQPSQFEAGGRHAGRFWAFFFPALTANVSFWATLALNIPDFSRYARSQRDQLVGQAIGLPPTMALFSF